MQPAFAWKDEPGVSEIRIAAYEIADLQTHSKMSSQSDIETSSILQRSLAGAAAGERVVRPAPAEADPWRQESARQQLQAQRRGYEDRRKVVQHVRGIAGQRDFLRRQASKRHLQM